MLLICFLVLLSTESIRCNKKEGKNENNVCKLNKNGELDKFCLKLLIVSFDGMTQRDVNYLNQEFNGNSTFDHIQSIGVSSQLLTSFPSKTFPAHMRIASVRNGYIYTMLVIYHADNFSFCFFQ